MLSNNMFSEKIEQLITVLEKQELDVFTQMQIKYII